MRGIFRRSTIKAPISPCLHNCFSAFERVSPLSLLTSIFALFSHSKSKTPNFFFVWLSYVWLKIRDSDAQPLTGPLKTLSFIQLWIANPSKIWTWVVVVGAVRRWFSCYSWWYSLRRQWWLCFFSRPHWGSWW